ncbi:PREDICTED: uncharacterized protein LOC105359529 [Ceratosolen solmsi marchali]|uniref:Uncharacterized protein LOC105359529 n=1 Tax=Ceratosolen solmsi marchali TaxID=326594 RepID=A0AAJ6YBK2_9HYME|nr:PREDICTED: uncharacterized protein LOC105359529 [Ceratosolen solmsi marchali]
MRENFAFVRHSGYLVPLLSIYISALQTITIGCWVIPEADQQGVLHSFKSYEDLVVFHYSVPKQVLYASWQFSAFANNEKCPARNVHVFLKWGSYPVIDVDNATYPSYMFVEHSDTTKASIVTAYESKSIEIIPIYSPVPGDWFVSAYLSHWDEEVYQKGLGCECHYSLSSVALWSEINGIANIPLGYQRTMRTSGVITYYKIYIPMDTWSFYVDVWGCNFTLKRALNHREACVEHLALEGQTLPVYNRSNPGNVGNLSSSDTYEFTEMSPCQDCWYYLMVVSSSVVTFDILVTVFDCPVKTIEETHILQPRLGNTKVYLQPSSRLHLSVLKADSGPLQFMNQAYARQANLVFDKNKWFGNFEGDRNINACVPRYQLARIKHTEPFSRDYLLRVNGRSKSLSTRDKKDVWILRLRMYNDFQGQEWLTQLLALSDKYPIITQFNILPLVDIGGTLDISISLEREETFSKQRINVVVCISRGRVPNNQASGNVTCDNARMKMRLSSSGGMRNSSLLIPYPQPDTWYVALHTKCEINDTPRPCEPEQILVSLRIKLRACVFEGSNSCGRHGICQEIHKGLLSYSACKCFRGYQGWDCTDSSNSLSHFSILTTSLALTLSNVFFVPAIYLAFKRKLHAEGLIYCCAMLFSMVYHVCDQQFAACIAKFEVLQYCDFFIGLLAFWVTLVAMAEIPAQYTSFFHMLGAIIITFQIKSDKTGLLSISIPMIIGIAIPLTTYGYQCYKINKITWPKRIIKLAIGLSLAGLGILLFSFVETESNYQYVHSLWHAIIALSLIFLLPPMREDEILRSRYADELNNKHSPGNSAFNIGESHRNSQFIMDVN